jgi:hypothetical protein
MSILEADRRRLESKFYGTLGNLGQGMEPKVPLLKNGPNTSSEMSLWALHDMVYIINK